jgi:hypothetical protein
MLRAKHRIRAASSLHRTDGGLTAGSYTRRGVPPDAQAPAGSLRDPLEEPKGIDVLQVDLTVTGPRVVARCAGVRATAGGFFDD